MADFAAIRFQPSRPLLRELSADRLNSILAEIKRNKPLPGRGVTVRQTGQGTAIDLAASIPRGGTSTFTEAHPFQISSRQDPESDPENPSYLATVRPGTINTLLPTGILDGGGLEPHEVPADSLCYVVLQANSDGEQINTAAVSVESTAPEAQTPEIFSLPSQANFLIGLVYNSNVFQVQFTNLSVTGKQQFITSKTNAAVGELPYEIHYVWG
jgi:hypothetical protein